MYKNNRMIIAIFTSLISASTSGCLTGPAGRASNSWAENTIAASKLSSMVPDAGCKADGSAPVTTVACRNYIIGQWMSESEDDCATYLAQVTQSTAGWNLGLGWAAATFSTIAPIFTHPSAIKPLTATGAILTGAKTEYDSDVLLKNTIDVIVGAIREKRNEDRVIISQNMSATKNTDGVAFKTDLDSLAFYPLSVAAADVQKFHGDCSMNAGLVELAYNNQQGQNKTDAAVVAKTPAGSPPGGAGGAAGAAGGSTAPTANPVQPNLLGQKLNSSQLLVPR